MLVRTVGAITSLFFMMSVAVVPLAHAEEADAGCDRACSEAEDDCFSACSEDDDECAEECAEIADRCFDACEDDE